MRTSPKPHNTWVVTKAEIAADKRPTKIWHTTEEAIRDFREAGNPPMEKQTIALEPTQKQQHQASGGPSPRPSAENPKIGADDITTNTAGR